MLSQPNKDESLTEDEWKEKLWGYIRAGKQVNTDKENFPTVRKWLYQLACWLEDNNQGVYITICLNELTRLEREFGVFKKEGEKEETKIDPSSSSQ